MKTTMSKAFMLERLALHRLKKKQDKQFADFHIRAIAYYRQMIKELKYNK